MKCSLAFLVLSTQVLYAGLERYSHLVVADVLPAVPAGGEVRIPYLGTNGFQFESGNNALLVEPYFSRIMKNARILVIQRKIRHAFSS